MRSLTFWDPSSIFAGFDDDFFARSPFLSSPLFGAPLTLAQYPADTIWRSSPRYEVIESDKQFRLAVDVPGVKHDDMTIELEKGGRVLRLSGGRKANTDTSYEECKFDRRFTLGNNLDTSKITAHLSDGVLVLTAPKKEELPPIKQVIPIIRGEAPALKGVDLTKQSKL